MVEQSFDIAFCRTRDGAAWRSVSDDPGLRSNAMPLQVVGFAFTRIGELGSVCGAEAWLATRALPMVASWYEGQC